MDITLDNLLATSQRAKSLGHTSAADILISFRNQLRDKGVLSERQESYATDLLAKYSPDAVQQKMDRHAQILLDWSNRDEYFLSLLDLITGFYVTSACRSYPSHMLWMNRPATIVRQALGSIKANPDADVVCPVQEIQRLYNSKLFQKLKDCHDSTPMYSPGDLVSVRGTGKVFQSWRIVEYSHLGFEHGYKAYDDRKVAEPYRTALVAEVLNATFACRQLHKTKGSTRLYKIIAFSGGRQDETWVCESDIRMVK